METSMDDSKKDDESVGKVEEPSHKDAGTDPPILETQPSLRARDAEIRAQQKQILLLQKQVQELREASEASASEAEAAFVALGERDAALEAARHDAALARRAVADAKAATEEARGEASSVDAATRHAARLASLLRAAETRAAAADRARSGAEARLREVSARQVSASRRAATAEAEALVARREATLAGEAARAAERRVRAIQEAYETRFPGAALVQDEEVKSKEDEKEVVSSGEEPQTSEKVSSGGEQQPSENILSGGEQQGTKKDGYSSLPLWARRRLDDLALELRRRKEREYELLDRLNGAQEEAAASGSRADLAQSEARRIRALLMTSKEESEAAAARAEGQRKRAETLLKAERSANEQLRQRLERARSAVTVMGADAAGLADREAVRDRELRELTDAVEAARSNEAEARRQCAEYAAEADALRSELAATVAALRRAQADARTSRTDADEAAARAAHARRDAALIRAQAAAATADSRIATAVTATSNETQQPDMWRDLLRSASAALSSRRQKSESVENEVREESMTRMLLDRALGALQVLVLRAATLSGGEDSTLAELSWDVFPSHLIQGPVGETADAPVERGPTLPAAALPVARCLLGERPGAKLLRYRGVLDLSGASIGDEGVALVSAALLQASEGRLRVLDLRGCFVTDAGARTLCPVLGGPQGSGGEHIALLDLRGNSITQNGVVALAEAMRTHPHIAHVVAGPEGMLRGLAESEAGVHVALVVDVRNQYLLPTNPHMDPLRALSQPPIPDDTPFPESFAKPPKQRPASSSSSSFAPSGPPPIPPKRPASSSTPSGAKPKKSSTRNKHKKPSSSAAAPPKKQPSSSSASVISGRQRSARAPPPSAGSSRTAASSLGRAGAALLGGMSEPSTSRPATATDIPTQRRFRAPQDGDDQDKEDRDFDPRKSARLVSKIDSLLHDDPMQWSDPAHALRAANLALEDDDQ